jgi:diguanylate cyclase (GGDEF)-like protein
LNKISPDLFPCLLFSTDLESNNLDYANQYAIDSLGINANTSITLFDLISKASCIFFESYIRPELLKSGQCNEVQITLISEQAKKVPAVANVHLVDSIMYWSIYTAEDRDKLYQELLLTRKHLETQNEELLLLSRKDPLTSLLNRRAAADDFIKIKQQLTRSFVPISFLIIDIDWFKAINDNYGHEVGDEILIVLSNTLKEVSRNTDILARWGGEEFLIILYNSDITSAEHFSSRLHEKVKLIVLPNNKSLTVSIGATSLDKKELGENGGLFKALKRADNALYLAKEKGRNRTEIIT